MKKLFIFSLFCLFLTTAAYSGQMSNIQLSDGSTIKAEIVSFANNTYTLNTGSLGEIKIDASKVRRIDTVAMDSAPNMKSELDSVREKMAGNADVQKIVGGLASDPQFQEITKDPDIINAAKSGDVQALMSNKKFMDLVNHPKVKEIKNKLEEKNP